MRQITFWHAANKTRKETGGRPFPFLSSFLSSAPSWLLLFIFFDWIRRGMSLLFRFHWTFLFFVFIFNSSFSILRVICRRIITRWAFFFFLFFLILIEESVLPPFQAILNIFFSIIPIFASLFTFDFFFTLFN
ncbi:hypothetical protein BCI9360_00561 [Bacillus sp. CECT 9360]|nr:hypothetical protein BCI9360_00561 [Bacillus sp. CECT 9360]